MAYILQKEDKYCFLDERDKVGWTHDSSLATRFTDIKKAYDLLYWARRKLKGFKVVDLDEDMGEASIAATKRKTFSEQERKAVYNSSKGRCAICGKFVPYEAFTIDHIIPLAKGGTNEIANLQCAHSWCDHIKQDASIEELVRKLVGIVLYQLKVWIGGSVKRTVGCLKDWRHKVEDTANH